MNCNEAKPLLNPLCDGELDTKDAALILEHIKSCLDCQSEWTELEKLRDRFKEARSKSQPDRDYSKRISQALKREDSAQPSSRGARFTARIIVAAACVMGMSLLVSYMVPRNSDTQVATTSPAIASLIEARQEAPQSAANADSLSSITGYDLKLIRIPNWQVATFGALNLNSGGKIARMDFVNATSASSATSPSPATSASPPSSTAIRAASSPERLCCYQALQGSIKMDTLATACESRSLGGKTVHLGTYKDSTFALWSQNKRDYLLVSSLPMPALESLVCTICDGKDGNTSDKL